MHYLDKLSSEAGRDLGLSQNGVGYPTNLFFFFQGRVLLLLLLLQVVQILFAVADPAKNLTTAEMGERSTTPFSDHTLF